VRDAATLAPGEEIEITFAAAAPGRASRGAAPAHALTRDMHG